MIEVSMMQHKLFGITYLLFCQAKGVILRSENKLPGPEKGRKALNIV